MGTEKIDLDQTFALSSLLRSLGCSNETGCSACGSWIVVVRVVRLMRAFDLFFDRHQRAPPGTGRSKRSRHQFRRPLSRYSSVHMTNDVRQRMGRQLAPHDAGDLNGQSSALRAIEDIATVVRLKRGDKLDFGKDRAKLVYAVRSGYLILQADLPAARRIAVALYAPGSILRLCELPAEGPLAGVATATCQILRMGEASFDRLCEQSAEVRLYCARETSIQSARDKAHIVLLAGFSGQERVASFFVDMAFRMGRRHGDVVTIELPFSRRDIANFLSLNPDTLSRIFSRLKSMGLIRTSGRRSVEILDLKGLARICPSGLAHREADIETAHWPMGIPAVERQ